MPDPSRRRAAVRLAVLVSLLVAAVVVQQTLGLPSQAELRGLLDGLGAWAVPAYVLAYVAVCLLPAGPTAVLTIAGGALLGFAVALPATLLGAVLGALVAFAVARGLGREAVRRVSGSRVRALDERVRRHGLGAVLLARLVPLVPFSTANFAFGLTGISARHYLVGTAVGIVPGTAVYVAVGAFGTDPTSWPFWAAIAGLVALTAAGIWRNRRTASSAA